MLTYENITGKIITADKAMKLFTSAFRKRNRIVFTNGCFDLLHRGHVYNLSRAREIGDILVVGLNSDASVSRLKGPGRPVNPQQARAEVLAAMAFVDFVIIFHEDKPLNLISTVKPHILVKGGDYKVEEVVGYREVTSWGGRVEIIPLLEGYSTSSMIDRSS
ncbi:MAG: D-glycero-beta-D-manno-heptose 1-phosphate adenylyltransferase [Bacteroidales bacterium]|nr:D-glycero-beta-D-manno-heptose 1-phosphate adenylyltransferase [Bacteroidales bacterium]